MKTEKKFNKWLKKNKLWKMYDIHTGWRQIQDTHTNTHTYTLFSLKMLRMATFIKKIKGDTS